MTMRYRLPVISSMWALPRSTIRPLPGSVGGFNALRPDDDAAGGKIRSGDEFHQELDGDIIHRVVVVDQVDEGCGQFFQVMRWDVGCHADRDTG